MVDGFEGFRTVPQSGCHRHRVADGIGRPRGGEGFQIRLIHLALERVDKSKGIFGTFRIDWPICGSTSRFQVWGHREISFVDQLIFTEHPQDFPDTDTRVGKVNYPLYKFTECAA